MIDPVETMKFRRSMSIKKQFTPPQRKRFNQIDLSMSTKQIILGSLLGDGSLKIAKGYKNARFSERHSVTQQEYLLWKFSKLKHELKGSITKSKPDKHSYSNRSKIIYQSAVSEQLTGLHHLTHKQNKKVIKRQWLNNLDALALTLWWCDDGSLNVRTRQGVFCTDSFSYKEQLLLVRYLKIDWKIQCTIIPNPVKTKQGIRTDYRLRFSTLRDFEDFLLLILPHIPVPSMLYKVMICYNDPKNQQRWISQVKIALPQFTSTIEKVYEQPFHEYKHWVNKRTGLTFRDIFYLTKKFQQYLALENDIVQ